MAIAGLCFAGLSGAFFCWLGVSLLGHQSYKIFKKYQNHFASKQSFHQLPEWLSSEQDKERDLVMGYKPKIAYASTIELTNLVVTKRLAIDSSVSSLMASDRVPNPLPTPTQISSDLLLPPSMEVQTVDISRSALTIRR